MVLSNREKLMLGLLAVSLLLSAMYYGGRELNAYKQELRGELARQEAMLRQATVIVSELDNLRTPSKTRGAPIRSLLGYVEQLMARINLKDRVQLNLVEKSTSNNLQGLDIKVDNLTLDEMVNLVFSLENAENPLFIEQMELSPSFKDKELLRVSMRVLANS